jgi:D-xylose transport system substrate-binding protein
MGGATHHHDEGRYRAEIRVWRRDVLVAGTTWGDQTMKLKKTSVALFSAMALFAAACGSDAKDAVDGAAEAVDTAAEAVEEAVTETTVAGATEEAAETTVAAVAEGAAPAGGKAGFILPDSKSSARWEAFDRKYIGEACVAAGIECDIQNAEGDKAKMATIADGMIASGVKVLALVNLDSPSAVAIQEKAAAAGVKLIDYDRLTLNGKTDVYVSFDNVAVGKAQGEGLIKCLGDTAGKKIIQLHGSPTDNNATLFKQGYQEAIASSGLETVAEEAVPDWDNVKGGQIFEQLLTKAGGKIDGVLVANDGLSLAAQAVLEKNGLTIPTTGQDATRDGLAAVLKGTQCMTVYKSVKIEAEAAVAAAVGLLAGKDAASLGNATINDGARDLPYSQAPITPIFKDNVKVVTDDGFVTKEELCTGDIAALCEAAGI